MKNITVLIADSHELIRTGIKAVLSSEPDIDVIGEAMSGIELLEQVASLKPGLAVLEVVMPRLDGIEAIRKIRGAKMNTRLLVLSVQDSEISVRAALRAGADGYILKSDPVCNLKAAVRAICAGGKYLSPCVGRRQRGAQKPPIHREDAEVLSFQLTGRELEVAKALSVGHSSKTIAEILRISVRTVETHRANIMRKLDVHSVTELLYCAFSHGIFNASANRGEQCPRSAH